MASSSQPRILAFKATAAMTKYKCVKPGADDDHVQVASAGTDKCIGIAQSQPTAAEDPMEVAINGGGGKALLGSGGAAFGDKLVSDANGALVVSTSANDRIVAIAMQTGVENDVIGVEVALSNL